MPVLSPPFCCQHRKNPHSGSISSTATRQDRTVSPGTAARPLAPRASLSHPCTVGRSSRAPGVTQAEPRSWLSPPAQHTPTQPLLAAVKGETCHHREQISCTPQARGPLLQSVYLRLIAATPAPASPARGQCQLSLQPRQSRQLPDSQLQSSRLRYAPPLLEIIILRMQRRSGSCSSLPVASSSQPLRRNDRTSGSR